jgi:hypothetical protein
VEILLQSKNSRNDLFDVLFFVVGGDYNNVRGQINKIYIKTVQISTYFVALKTGFDAKGNFFR